MPEHEAPLQLLSQAQTQLVNREAWQNETAARNNIDGAEFSNIKAPWEIKHLLGSDDLTPAFDSLTHALGEAQGDDEAVEILRYIDGLYEDTDEVQKETSTNPFLSNVALPELVDPQKEVLANPRVQEFINSRDISGSQEVLKKLWPQFVETFTAGVENGIAQGYLPPVMATRLEDSLSKTGVKGADRAILTAHGNMSAYYNREEDEVGVTYDLQHPEFDSREDLVHEFVHKFSGGTFRKLEADSREYRRGRVGFSTELKPQKPNRVGLNEATTHHVTLGILTGDFETLDPDERADGDVTYYSYRKVLAAFVDRAQATISVKTVTNSLFEDSGPQGSTVARRELIREVTQTYGAGALTSLDKLFELSDMVDEDHLNEIVLSRIHPPKLDEHGRITTKGHIDTNNLPSFLDLLTKT